MPTGGEPVDADATQREGSRLERLLRELERNLEEADGSAAGPDSRQALPPPTPMPDAEEIEDRDVPGGTRAGREPGAGGRAGAPAAGRTTTRRRRGSSAVGSRRPRRGAVSSPRRTTRGSTQRIRQEPADHTAVRKYTPAQLRDAIVWREILGPPVSERD